MKTLLIVTLLAVLAVGCTSSDKAFQKVPLDEVFTLSHGGRAKVDDRFTLTFDSVAEDSRCPTGTQCLWEGNGAGVLLYFLCWSAIRFSPPPSRDSARSRSSRSIGVSWRSEALTPLVAGLEGVGDTTFSTV